MPQLALLTDALFFGLVLLGGGALFAWQYARHGSAAGESPGWIRWVVSALLIALFVVVYRRVNPSGSAPAAFLVLIAGIVVSVLLGILWLPTVVGGLLSPLTGSLTGGEEKIEQRPAYYRAIAHRKRGEHAAAVAAVRAELERFPGDVEGMLMLVDLHAIELRDPLAAREVLDELLADPGTSATDRALALSRLADLQLKGFNDPEAARATLELIALESPESPAGHLARQRMAHLPGANTRLPSGEPARLMVAHHEERLGLTEDLGAGRLQEEDPTAVAQQLVAHLAIHPDDWEARERLARLYADALGHLHLATGELEQLLALNGVPPRHVVRWFHELADLQLKAPDGLATARATLERLRERFPETVWAAQAEARMRQMGLDQRAREAPHTLKLGQYEQRVGLMRGDAGIPDPSRVAPWESRETPGGPPPA